VISHYPNSMCHSKLIINKFILTTSLFVLTLSGFFLNLFDDFFLKNKGAKKGQKCRKLM